jgi:uncharacterized protein YndB with AHSA1/START domain
MTGTALLPTLTHSLDRTVVIEAPRELVFRFFTDDQRWAAWWGAGSTIDSKTGGALLIRHPDGTEVVGEVLDVRSPERIVFTYGYASGRIIPPGGSRVTIRLDPDPRGTRLHLCHEFADAPARDMHVQGWRFQLSLFGNVVSNELHANASAAVDEWFGVWVEDDAERRRQRLAAIAAAGVRFRDRFSLVDGLDELSEQIGAALRFMPGLRLERQGEVRQCQGIVIVEWAAMTKDTQERGRGTSVFALASDGRIESVTGFWPNTANRA